MADIEIEDISPQSPIQEAVFLQSRHRGGASVHIIQVVSKLRGRLSVPAFEQSWGQAIRRHPILRTLFMATRQKKYVQVVCRRVAWAFELGNWRGLSDQEQRETLQT